MTAPSNSRNHVLERIRTATYPVVDTSLIERAYGEAELRRTSRPARGMARPLL